MNKSVFIKKILLKKNTAASLVFAVFIMVIISLICSAIITMFYYHKIINIKYLQYEQAYTNLNSAIIAMLDHSTITEYNQLQPVNLYDENTNQIFGIKKKWGSFNVLTAFTLVNKDTITKMALSGNWYHPQKQNVLCLSDLNKPLTVCGSTKIKGNVILPSAGAKTGFINGIPFSGNKTIEGKIETKNQKIPLIQDDWKEYLNSLKLNNSSNQKNNSLLFHYKKNDTINNSFSNPSIIYQLPAKTKIDNLNLSGNIILQSTNTIVIGNKSSLNNILIAAKNVVVEKGVVGSFQIIASDTVIISQDVVLQYPSSIVISSSNKNAIIFLDKNSTIYGNIILYEEKNSYENSSTLYISENAIIYGLVYCKGAIEHKGKIYGSVTCEKFILRTASSFYENHLFNSDIITLDDMPMFVSNNLSINNSNEHFIQWLY